MAPPSAEPVGHNPPGAASAAQGADLEEAAMAAEFRLRRPGYVDYETSVGALWNSA